MTTKAVFYKTSNGEDFMKLEGHKRGHQYSVKFLEKLAGFKLSEWAGWSLRQYGYIRVTKGVGSYRKD